MNVANAQIINDVDSNAPVYETLVLLPSYGLEVRPEFAEIIHDLGDGYQAGAQMGDSRGIEYFGFKFTTVPQTLAQAIVIDEQGNKIKAIVYLWDFVRRHRRTRPFYIKHPITEAQELVVIHQYDAYRLTNPYLWESGLTMRTWRGAGDSASNEEFNESSPNAFTI